MWKLWPWLVAATVRDTTLELKGTGKNYKGRWDAVSGTMTGMQSVGREKQRISWDG